MKVVLLAIVLVLLSVLMLGVRVLFVKGGRFPSSHVGDNPELLRRGAECASHHESKKINHIEKQ